MTTLFLDLETRSRLNLKMVGAHIYAQDCEITLNSWAVDDSKVWVEEELSDRFLHALHHPNTTRVVSHGDFDPIVLSQKIPDLPLHKWYNTMAQARRHGLPGALEKLCEILKVPADLAKMTEAHADMLLFCKPLLDGTWATKATHPERWARFRQYGGLDVEAMREVHKRCPKWNDTPFEFAVERADYAINERGFAVDIDFCEKAIDVLNAESRRLDARAVDESKGDLDSARQRDVLLSHLLMEHGVSLPDLRAATLERRLKDENLPEGLRSLLLLRLESSRTSTSKYKTVERRAGLDGRVRGTMVYCGAHKTKRWSGKDVQPHNLMRPSIGKLRGKTLAAEVRWGIAATKAGVLRDLATHPVTSILASAVRGVIVPEPGFKIVSGDWSNVEGRGLAWAAYEESALDAFREYDAGTGSDIYKLAYSNATGVPVDDVDDGTERQIGKVMELFMGYEGGVGAFVTGAAAYRVELATIVSAARSRIPPDIWAACERWYAVSVGLKKTYGLPKDIFCTCDGLKRLWRDRRPKTVALWADVKAAIIEALRTKRETAAGRFCFDVKGTYLRMRLPSGGYLSYAGAQAVPEGDEFKIRYWGENQYTKKMGWINTYGGKIVENGNQALCRDILAWTLVKAEEDGFPTVLHVHDEPNGEVAEEHAEGWARWLGETMRAGPPWAAGLPLAADIKILSRYEKL